MIKVQTLGMTCEVTLLGKVEVLYSFATLPASMTDGGRLH